MNEHKNFNKRFYETLKCLSSFYVEIERFILFFIFIVFEQLRQRANDACIKSYETFIKVCEFQEYLKLSQCLWLKSSFNKFYATLIYDDIIIIDDIF